MQHKKGILENLRKPDHRVENPSFQDILPRKKFCVTVPEVRPGAGRMAFLREVPELHRHALCLKQHRPVPYPELWENS